MKQAALDALGLFGGRSWVRTIISRTSQAESDSKSESKMLLPLRVLANELYDQQTKRNETKQRKLPKIRPSSHTQSRSLSRSS